MRTLIPLLLALAFTGGSVAPGDVMAEDRKPRDAELVGGKTLDEWIAQARQGPTLEDRHGALQTLRNLGLNRDRDKTLRAFTELLSDEAPTVRSLAAAGLRKAGRPTDPRAAAGLVEIIAKDLSGLKPPKKAGEVGAEFGGVMRAIGALEVVGDAIHVAALKRVSENEQLEPIIRQAAQRAIGQIEKRARKAGAGSTVEARERDDELRFINVPASALPKQVRLAENTGTAPIIQVKGNPGVVIEPKSMALVASFYGINDASDLAPVLDCVVAVYQENEPGNEIGVFGLCYSDEAAASKRFEKLAMGKKDSPFILKGALLLYVWKDSGASNEAFEAVRAYLSTAEFKPDGA